MPVKRRKGFVDGLAALANADPRIVVLDGDVMNSTYAEEFKQGGAGSFPGRLYRGAEYYRNGHGAGGAWEGSVCLFIFLLRDSSIRLHTPDGHQSAQH